MQMIRVSIRQVSIAEGIDHGSGLEGIKNAQAM